MPDLRGGVRHVRRARRRPGGPRHRRSRRPLVVRLHLLEGSRRARRSTTPPTASTCRRSAATASSCRCTWDEALDDIAALTRGIVAEHGPVAVAHYMGTGGPLDPAGYAMGHGFFRALGTDQHYSALSIDCSGKALVPQLVAGVQLMFQPDLERATCCWPSASTPCCRTATGGCSPTRSSQLRSCGPAAARSWWSTPPDGDAPSTPTSTCRCGRAAIRLCSPSPSRRVLAQRPDAAYLAACVDAGSLERLRRAVAPFDRDRTAAICGVPVETSTPSPPSWSTAGRVAIETGTGMTMNRSANLTEWLVWALGAVTGSLDRDGGATFNPGFLRRIEDALPERPRRPRAPRRRAGPTCPASSTARSRARRWPTRSRPATSGPCSCGSATRRWPSPATPALRARSRSSTCWSPSTCTPPRPPRWPPTCCRWPTTSSAATWSPATCRPGRSCASPGRSWTPTGERRTQWWMFAELSRRLGLPLFGSARRDAALADRELDDEVIAEAMAIAGAGRGARCGPRPTACRDELGAAGVAGARAAPAAASTSRPPSSSPSSSRRPSPRRQRSSRRWS